MDAPRRPILVAACAVFAGSALGASGILPQVAARGILLALGAAWIACPRRWISATPVAAIALAAALAGASALRSGLAARADPRTAGTLPAGTWRSLGARGDRDLGSLGRGSPTFAFVRGTVGAGEEIAVLGQDLGPPLAEGPAAGPRRARGLARAPVERAPDEIVRLSTGRTDDAAPAWAPLERVRDRLLERLDRLADPRTRGLVAGLLFGDLAGMPRDVGDLFVRTGTFHVLAISGLQVALFAVLLAGPLARLLALLARVFSGGRVRSGFEPVRAAILVLFVPVAGAGPPVTRSALAWVVGSMSATFRARKPFARIGDGEAARDRFLPRTRDPLAVWSLALLCECLVHADAPLSLSVQLTYAATLGLILATGPIRGLLVRALPGGGRVAANGPTGRRRSELGRVLAQKLVDASVYSVAASLAAVLATSAIVWSHFGEWSPAGILATSAIALPVAWILVAGWIWLLAPALVPEALLDLPCRGMVRALEAFDAIPGSPCPLPPRPALLLALATGLALLALARSRQGAWSRCAAGAWAALLLPWTLAPAALEVHALDVGHGTAVLLHGPGGSAWIFDAGSRDRPEVDREALGPLLREWDVARVGVVLSHSDRDHDGALDWLVERYPPAVWAGALPAQIGARLPHTTARLDLRRGEMRLPDLDPSWSGADLELSRGLDVEGNEGSRCLEVTLGSEAIVLSGDAEAEGLAAWLAQRPGGRRTRMLLFPHHGSDTELLGRLLGSLRPGEVWLSASGSPPVTRELERRGVRTRCTSLEGSLRLDLR